MSRFRPYFRVKTSNVWASLLDDRPAAAPAAAVGGVVELAAAGLADERFDFLGPVGMYRSLQPVEEQVLDLVRQPQQHPRGAACARLGDRLQDAPAAPCRSAPG